MAVLSHRTQLLLDDERHRRLEREARRTGRSVGSLVREAIDLRFGSEELIERRREAAARLLAAPRPDDQEPDWAKVEQELLDATAPGYQ
ncbi:MAG TPA: ribbon-helix-helix protein, CopG family [Solirubrobacteraceae bacterium]|jgi:predicted DNA-binding protein|nr:ribbon-helix-helix protein, CopG family [Solirubrobacteraceae bacterium]